MSDGRLQKFVNKYILRSGDIKEKSIKGRHMGDGSGFVDRGDNATIDFDQSIISVNGAWTELDLSNIVPPTAKAVALRVHLVDSVVGTKLTFRKMGNSNSANVNEVEVNVANVSIYNTMIVPCNETPSIEYLQSDDIQAINVNVIGWWL